MHSPIGTSNFRKLIEYKDPDGIGYLFVYKTLNLSMLHHLTYTNPQWKIQTAYLFGIYID